MIEHEFEAGIVLRGTDVKAIRANKFEVRDAFIREYNSELYVWNIIFSEHPSENKDDRRKLLLHKSELRKIQEIKRDKRYHGFILKVRYNSRNLIKFDIGFGRVKKAHDKKSADKRTTEKRILEKEIQNY